MSATCNPRRGRWLAAVTPLIIASAAVAHPLGNENVEHISVLWIMPDRLEVDFLLLIAETPSMVVREKMDTDRDDNDTAAEQKAWLEKKAVALQSELRATIDGERLPLRVAEEVFDPATGRKLATTKIILKMPGFAGMPTYQLLIRYVGRYPKPLTAGKHVITYEDATYSQDQGLKRIVLERVPDVEVIPPHPAFWGDGEDPRMYEQYDPANLPQERRATARFRVIAPAAATGPAGLTATQPAADATPPATASTQVTPSPVADRGPATAPALAAAPGITTRPAERERLSEPGFPSSVQGKYQRQADRVVALLKGRWGFMMFLTVTVLPFGWGAAHALMPGHAKTIVAAYLISQKGTYWHAVLLAIVVTITHTALVVVMGVIWAYYQATNPELGPRLQLWLGVISGLLVAGMGVVLIWRASTGRLGHHPHEHEHRHDDRSRLRKLFTHSHPHLPAHDHAHPHRHDHAPTEPGPGPSDRPLTIKLLLMLGITGGIVPCPTAAIIMLLGIGANVVIGALYAVGIFSLGLALTLMLVGFLALSSRRVATRLLSDARHEGELSGRGRWLMLRVVPTISGLAVVVLGGLISANYIYRMTAGTALFRWMG